MNIAICDDDKIIITQVKKYLETFFCKEEKYTEIYTFTSGEEMLSKNVQFDLCFIDIEMPGMGGLEVAKRILDKNEHTIVIIITSYNHYLDDAMELRVYRYISKPFDEERFFSCLKSAYRRYLTHNKPIRIKSNDEISKINSCDIIYISIEHKKVYVHTYDEDIRTTEDFKYWLSELDDMSFYRCHQSFLVNLSYVRRISKGECMMVCKDRQYFADVSARKYANFKKRFYDYLGGAY